MLTFSEEFLNEDRADDLSTAGAILPRFLERLKQVMTAEALATNSDGELLERSLKHEGEASNAIRMAALPDETTWKELRSVLDEELPWLPEQLRAPWQPVRQICISMCIEGGGEGVWPW